MGTYKNVSLKFLYLTTYLKENQISSVVIFLVSDIFEENIEYMKHIQKHQCRFNKFQHLCRSSENVEVDITAAEVAEVATARLHPPT